MKKVRKILMVTFLLTLFMCNIALASNLNWENIMENQEPCILLEEGVMSSSDEFHQYGRGEYLAEGSVEIANQRNGNIYIRVETLAYVYVDRIQHSVFLECWDEDEEAWIQVGSWDFEKTKEEAKAIIDEYFKMIDGKEYDEEMLQEAVAMKNVYKQANRIKCATIGWKAIQSILESEPSNE